MKPPASTDELSQLLDAPVSALRAVLALEAATSALVSALGWDPDEAQRVLTVIGGARTVVVPALNVTALTVLLDGNPPRTPVDWTESGIIRLGSGYREAVITYTAGWSTAGMPGVFKAVVLEEAARWLDNPRGLRSRNWSIGAESEQETYAIGSIPSPVDDTRLAPYQLGLVTT
jgi:hypothetical protein